MLLVIDNNYIQFPDVRAKIIKETDNSTIVSWLTLDGTLLGKSEFKSKNDFEWLIKDMQREENRSEMPAYYVVSRYEFNF